MSDIFTVIKRQSETEHGLILLRTDRVEDRTYVAPDFLWAEYLVPTKGPYEGNRIKLLYRPDITTLSVQSNQLGRMIIRDFDIQYPESLDEIQKEIGERIESFHKHSIYTQ